MNILGFSSQFYNLLCSSSDAQADLSQRSTWGRIWVWPFLNLAQQYNNLTCLVCSARVWPLCRIYICAC